MVSVGSILTYIYKALTYSLTSSFGTVMRVCLRADSFGAEKEKQVQKNLHRNVEVRIVRVRMVVPDDQVPAVLPRYGD